MSLREQVAAAEAAGKAERITTERVKLEEGHTLIGVYVGREAVKSTDKKMPDFFSYDFETDDGPVNTKFSGAFDKSIGGKLVEHNVYSITYKGKVKLSGDRTMNVFVVKGFGPSIDLGDNLPV